MEKAIKKTAKRAAIENLIYANIKYNIADCEKRGVMYKDDIKNVCWNYCRSYMRRTIADINAYTDWYERNTKDTNSCGKWLCGIIERYCTEIINVENARKAKRQAWRRESC